MTRDELRLCCHFDHDNLVGLFTRCSHLLGYERFMEIVNHSDAMYMHEDLTTLRNMIEMVMRDLCSVE